MSIVYYTTFFGRFTVGGKPLSFVGDTAPTFSLTSITPTGTAGTQTVIVTAALATLVTPQSSLFFWNYTGSTFDNATNSTNYIATFTYNGTQTVDATVVDALWTRFAVGAVINSFNGTINQDASGNLVVTPTSGSVTATNISITAGVNGGGTLNIGGIILVLPPNMGSLGIGSTGILTQTGSLTGYTAPTTFTIASGTAGGGTLTGGGGSLVLASNIGVLNISATTGLVTAGGGTLDLLKAGTVTSVPALTGGTVDLVKGGTVGLAGSLTGYTAPTTFTIASGSGGGGTLTGGGGSLVLAANIGTLSITAGGLVTTGAGTINLTGSLTGYAAPTTFTINSGTGGGGTLTGGGGSLVLAPYIGVLSLTSGGLVTTSAGTINLTGSLTGYTAPTTFAISSGTGGGGTLTGGGGSLVLASYVGLLGIDNTGKLTGLVTAGGGTLDLLKGGTVTSVPALTGGTIDLVKGGTVGLAGSLTGYAAPTAMSIVPGVGGGGTLIVGGQSVIFPPYSGVLAITAAGLTTVGAGTINLTGSLTGYTAPTPFTIVSGVGGGGTLTGGGGSLVLAPYIGLLSISSGGVVSANAGSLTLSSGERLALADAILTRDMSAVSETPGVRTPLQALRFLRNKWALSSTTLSVYKEDDGTLSWTAAVTQDASALPITASDPA